MLPEVVLRVQPLKPLQLLAFFEASLNKNKHSTRENRVTRYGQCRQAIHLAVIFSGVFITAGVKYEGGTPLFFPWRNPVCKVSSVVNHLF